MVSTPARHAVFYRDALAAAPPAGGRILIAGSADYGMLAQVLAACARPVEVTVVDLCETPLALCRWYAERLGTTVHTVIADALGFVSDRPFDVVCSHSVLGRFSADERRRLVAGWRDRLQPGGRVVTVNRVASTAAGAADRFAEPDASAFRDAVLAAARARPDLEVDAVWLGHAAEDYARRYRTRPIFTHEEALDLFTGAGFTLARADSIALEGRTRGPSTKQAAEYLHLVASRD